MQTVAVKQPLLAEDMRSIGGQTGVSMGRVQREVHLLSQVGLLEFSGLGYKDRGLEEGVTVESTLNRIYGPEHEQ